MKYYFKNQFNFYLVVVFLLKYFFYIHFFYCQHYFDLSSDSRWLDYT